MKEVLPLPDVPDVDITGAITLGPGEVLHRFSASTTRSGSSPVVRIHGSVTAEEMLIQIDPGVVVSLASPLLDVIDSTLVTPSAVVGVHGSISSSSPAPFLSFDPTTVTAAHVISVPGGTLSVAGPLIRAIDTTFVLSNSVMSLVDGAVVTKTGSAAAIQLLRTVANGTTATAGGNVISLGTTTPVAIRPTMTLAGPLLETVHAHVEGGTLGPAALLLVADGAVLTKTDATPLMSFTSSTIPNPGPVLILARAPGAAAISTLNLGAAPLLEATGSGLSSVSLVPVSGAACCPGFFVGQGAQLLATGSGALIRLTGSTFNAGAGGIPGGSFFVIFDDCPGCPGPFQPTTLVSIAGPLLEATDTAITTLFNLVFVGRSTLTGTGSGPLVTLTNATDRIYPFGGNDPIAGTLAFGGFLQVNGATGGSNAPTTVTLAGPLLHTTNTGGRTTFTTTGDFLSVVNGAQVTTTTTAPLIISDHSTFTVGSLANRRSFASVGGTGGATGVELARLSLRGPLLSATDDILDISGNVFTLFRSGAVIDTAAPSGEALLQFSNSTVTSTTAAIASVTGFNGGTSTLTLARPLLSATDTTITAATGLFRLFDGAQATSTATSPFVNVSGGAVTTGAAGPGTGGVFRMQSAAGQNATSFTIADGFLSATNGAVLSAAGQNGFVTLRNAAVLASTGATPFLDFHGASASAGQDMMVIGPFVAPGAVPPTVTLAGPLFRARDTGSPITFATGTGPITGIFLNINDGAVVTKTGGLPLIDLIGTLTTSFVEPLVQFSGVPTGPHLLVPDASPLRAMFDIRGLDFDSAFDPDPADPDVPVFTLGTLTPIQHASELFRGDNSTQVQTKQFVSLDTALFDASRPLMNLRNGSSLTSNSDLINLLLKAHLNASLIPGDALVTLNASTLTMNNGSLLNLTGASFAKVTGDLVRLDNNSTLNILNGNLVTVSNGSMFKLTGGSLGTFGATGTNTINITNNAACGGCSVVALPGITNGVLLRGGALAGNVIVQPGFVPFANIGGTNTVNISGTSGAVIVLDGSTSKAKLGP